MMDHVALGTLLFLGAWAAVEWHDNQQSGDGWGRPALFVIGLLAVSLSALLMWWTWNRVVADLCGGPRIQDFTTAVAVSCCFIGFRRIYVWNSERKKVAP